MASLSKAGSTIRGKGFVDKVEDGTFVEQFRDRLIATAPFAEGTRIDRMRAARSGDYSLDFSIVIELEEPIAQQD